MNRSKLYLVSRVALALGVGLLLSDAAIVMIAGLVGLLLVYSGHVPTSIWIDLIMAIAPICYMVALASALFIIIGALTDKHFKGKKQ